jgi:hypothetical protein
MDKDKGKVLDHIALANKNHDALMYLIQDHLKFPEWITTIAFYKAVQLVEAVCVFRRGRGCSGHDERSRVIQLAPFNQTKLFLHHKSLRNESEVARYLYDRESKKGYSSFSDRIPAGEVVDRIIRRRLVPLEEIVVGMLGKQAKAELRRIHVPSLPPNLPRPAESNS